MGFLDGKHRKAPGSTGASQTTGPKLPSLGGTTPPVATGMPRQPSGSSMCPHCGKDTNEAPTKAPKDVVRHMLDELDRAEGLSVWEDKFCVDMEASLEKYGSLTPRQFQTLQKIYDERVK